MATFKLVQTRGSFKAFNNDGELVACVSEDDGFIRVDYLECGEWEDTHLSGDFSNLTESQAKKIIGQYI